MAQPPPPPPSPQDAGAGPAAAGTLGVRFGARLLDGLLLGLVSLVISAPFDTGDTGAAVGFGFTGTQFVLDIVLTAVAIGYFVYFETTRGQTLGKMLLKLEVRGPTREYPTTEQSVRRNAWMALSIIPFLGGIAGLVAVIAIAVTINSSPTKQGWHDEFANSTHVIRTASVRQ